MDLKKYTLLKDKTETLQRKADKAAGAYDQLMNQLEKEFQVKSIKEGEKLQKKIEGEAEELEEKFDKLLKEFEGEYGILLEGE